MNAMRNIFCVVVALFLSQEPILAVEKVRISVSSLDVNFLTAGVASRTGLFRAEGLDAEVIRMNAPVSITALANGDIGYTMIFGSVVRAALQGFPVRVVASLMDRPVQTLLALPQYKTVKDLKGRTLGVSSFGATADLVARMMIKHFGIDPEKEMKIVALGAERARFSALTQGIVDVVVISAPADSEGQKLGYNVLARAYELFSFPFVGLGTNVKKIKESPDEVKRVLKALIKANRFIRDNREGTIQVLAEWGRTTPQLAAASYDSTAKVFNLDGSIPEDGLRRVVDEAKKTVKVKPGVQLSDVADVALLQEVQKELGMKGH